MCGIKESGRKGLAENKILEFKAGVKKQVHSKV